MKSRYWRIGKLTAVFVMLFILLVGNLLGPAPLVVRAGETIVYSYSFDTSGQFDSWSVSGSGQMTAGVSTYERYDEKDYFLLQPSAGALHLWDDETGAGEAYISRTIAGLTVGNWYAFRFYYRNGLTPSGNGDGQGQMYDQGRFRLGSQAWEDDYTGNVDINLNGNSWIFQEQVFKATTTNLYPVFIVNGDVADKDIYLDAIQLVEMPQVVSNDSFEDGTAANWTPVNSTLSVINPGYAGTYALKFTATRTDVMPGAREDGPSGGGIKVNLDQYYTLDCWVKGGPNSPEIRVRLGDTSPLNLGKYLNKTFSASNWVHVVHNFRTTSTTLFLTVETTAYGSPASNYYGYLDSVRIYNTRDEVQAALNDRAEAAYQMLERLEYDTTPGTPGGEVYNVDALPYFWEPVFEHGRGGRDTDSDYVLDRYWDRSARDFQEYARQVMAVANLYAWKYSYTGPSDSLGSGDGLKAAKVMDLLYDHGPSQVQNTQWYTNGMQTLFGMSGLHIPAVWYMWAMLDNTRRSEQHSLLTYIGSDTIDFLDRVEANWNDPLDTPDNADYIYTWSDCENVLTAKASDNIFHYGDVFAYDGSLENSCKGDCLDNDGRVEDTVGYAGTLVTLGNMFTRSTPGNGYWADKAQALSDAEAMMRFAVADNTTVSWRGTDYDQMYGVINDTTWDLAVPNHNFYPNLNYASVFPFIQGVGRMSYRLNNNATPPSVYSALTGDAMTSLYYLENYVRADRGIFGYDYYFGPNQDQTFITTTVVAADDAVNPVGYDGLHIKGPAAHFVKYNFLNFWEWLAGDELARYEATRITRMMRSSPNWWPDVSRWPENHIRCYTSAEWDSLIDGPYTHEGTLCNIEGCGVCQPFVEVTSWFANFTFPAENAGAMAFRWYITRGLQYNSFNRTYRFPMPPLTW